ncbi:hypothetical protein NKR23_g3569 [Pleurostoma richardsiae]|uniref:Mitochondrial import inner membrane translocase subunit n=1 Tax=Pleurostoma richardsiae TaxID=41990 RepID=A0AA38VWQ2_9PEZI|nr:hypothetical protein NKR23_g3569 [Pleurostoma richardsiae]
MDAAASLEQADLDKLNDKDKAELRQFISNEQQRTRVQSQTHALTDMCWKKCVTGPVKNGKLEKGEETCLASCVDRFLDVNLLTMKHLQSLRQG